MRKKTTLKRAIICGPAILFFLLLAWSSAGIAQEADKDTLPLGPSPYKFNIEKIEKDRIIQTAGIKEVTIPDIIKENKKTGVFIIGEAHNSCECHTFQRDFIEALVKENPKIVVGFEFFLREDAEALEAWRLGKISEEELLKKTGWYEKSSFNYGYTRFVMEIIQKYKIPVIGLNIPRTILRTVSRKGFEALSQEEKKLFPTIGIYNPEHEYFIKSIFAPFAVQVPMWFTNIYNAQKCWDVVMAESMRKKLAEPGFKGYRGVIIAGSNHVAYKLGIPFRYRAASKNTVITTIIPVVMPEEKKDSADEEENPMMKMFKQSLPPAAIFSRGIADYVFSIPRVEFEFFPALGMRTTVKENKIMVAGVTPKSIAEKYGLREGDEIIALDGVNITSEEQLRTLLALKNWDESFNLQVIKKIEIKKEKEKEDKPDVSK